MVSTNINCKNCEKNFEQKKLGQLYCSQSCREKFHNDMKKIKNKTTIENMKTNIENRDEKLHIEEKKIETTIIKVLNEKDAIRNYLDVRYPNMNNDDVNAILSIISSTLVYYVNKLSNKYSTNEIIGGILMDISEEIKKNVKKKEE